MSFLDTLLGRKHPPMIGLDISSSSVKLVELGQSGSGEYVLERFGSESFEKGWISDGQIEKFDEVAEAVKRLVTKSGTRTRQVVMAMPQSAVITKKIMLPRACAKRSSRSRSRPRPTSTSRSRSTRSASTSA